MARELRDLPRREIREDARHELRLFACSRLISSWMLTSESEVTCLSSSIFASSSAMAVRNPGKRRP